MWNLWDKILARYCFVVLHITDKGLARCCYVVLHITDKRLASYCYVVHNITEKRLPHVAAQTDKTEGSISSNHKFWYIAELTNSTAYFVVLLILYCYVKLMDLRTYCKY